MTLIPRIRVLPLILAAVFAASVLGAGAAMAQDGGDSPRTEDARRHPIAHRVLHGLFASIVENSGLEASAFREGFEAGKSINQVLEENGVEPAAVQAAVLEDVDAKLDALVAEGKLTQEQADRIYAAAEQKLPTLMDRVPDGEHRPHRLFRALRGVVRSAAEALGMESSKLAQRLRGGETVADVAAGQGVDLETVEAAVLADAFERIDAAVAEGRIDDARGEELKSNISERIESFLTEGRRGQE